MADHCKTSCSLAPEQLENRLVRLATLRSLILEVRDRPGGVELELEPIQRARVEATAFVEFERQCCGFAEFEVREVEERLWIEIKSSPQGLAEIRRIIKEKGQLGHRSLSRLIPALLGGATLAAVLCCVLPLVGAGVAVALGRWMDGLAVGLVAAAALVALLVWVERRRCRC